MDILSERLCKIEEEKQKLSKQLTKLNKIEATYIFVLLDSKIISNVEKILYNALRKRAYKTNKNIVHLTYKEAKKISDRKFSGVDKAFKKLQKKGFIKSVKGGHMQELWEIL